MITLDFETYYDREYSLSKITTEQYIRDPRFEVIGVGTKVDDQPTQWFSGSYAEISEHLLGLRIHEHYLLAHNTAFDGAILAWRFGIRPKYYIDTLSLARPLLGLTVGGSLAAVAKHFALGEKGTEVVKALGMHRSDFTSEALHEYGVYCMNDVELTFAAYQMLRQHTTPKEMFVIDLLLRMFTDPVLELDQTTLTEHLANVLQRKEELLGKLGLFDNATVDKARLMSNQKCAELLRSLGVDPPMKVSKKTGKPALAMAKNDLEFKALLAHPDEQVQALVAARLGVKSTLEETRTSAFIGIGQRGTLPIMLNYYGAHTGRASGGDSVNLQNLPRKGALRRAIRAPKGHLLVACDSSQIEARIVAWLADQQDLVSDFGNGVDIYSKFASDVYGRPVNRKLVELVDGNPFKPDEGPGFVGKVCVLQLGFGSGAEKLRQTLKIGAGGIPLDLPLDECERIVKQVYRKKYSRIPDLWESAHEALKAMVRGHSYEFGVNMKLLCDSEGVHLPNGMLIRYPELCWTKDGFRYTTRKGPVYIYGGKMVENVVQALARIVVFDQMCKIEQRLRPLDQPTRRHRVVLTVHDENVSCVPADYAEETKDLMTRIMSIPPSWAESLPVACEAGVGETYGGCK